MCMWPPNLTKWRALGRSRLLGDPWLLRSFSSVQNKAQTLHWLFSHADNWNNVEQCSDSHTTSVRNMSNSSCHYNIPTVLKKANFEWSILETSLHIWNTHASEDGRLRNILRDSGILTGNGTSFTSLDHYYTSVLSEVQEMVWKPTQ